MLGGCSLQVGGCKYKGGAAGSLSEMSEDDGGQRFYLGIVAGSCATLLGLTNLPLLCKVGHEFSFSLINKMIFVDCCLALLHIPLILHPIFEIKSSCTSRKYPVTLSLMDCLVDLSSSLYGYFVSCVNRLLPVGIVLFRYVYVCQVRSVCPGVLLCQ